MINVALDFDNTLYAHDIPSGGNVIHGGPLSGAMERLAEMYDHFDIDRIYIFSLRCYGAHGIEAMAKWIYNHLIPLVGQDKASYIVGSLIFTVQKPDNCVIIDDRCLQFKGDWSDPEFSVDAIANFKGWHA